MRPRRALPPVEYWRGVRPSQAANCRPPRNWLDVADGSGDRAGGQRADAAQAGDTHRARVVAGLLGELAVALGQVRVELAQVLELPRHASAQRRRQGLVRQGRACSRQRGRGAFRARPGRTRPAARAVRFKPAVRVAHASPAAADAPPAALAGRHDFTATKRDCGWRTAAQIAAASFVLFFPDKRNGRTRPSDDDQVVSQLAAARAALIRSNNVCRGFSNRERTASPIVLFGICGVLVSFEDLSLRVIDAIRPV